MPNSKILVVDDNKNFNAFIKAALEDEFEVYVSENGREGLESCKTVKPNLVLLDVNMPGMSGIEFVRRMCSDLELRGIPIILLTATDLNVITEKLIQNELSVKAFMSKLSPMEILKDKILKVLAKKL